LPAPFHRPNDHRECTYAFSHRATSTAA